MLCSSFPVPVPIPVPPPRPVSLSQHELRMRDSDLAKSQFPCSKTDLQPELPPQLDQFPVVDWFYDTESQNESNHKLVRPKMDQHGCSWIRIGGSTVLSILFPHFNESPQSMDHKLETRRIMKNHTIKSLNCHEAPSTKPPSMTWTQ